MRFEPEIDELKGPIAEGEKTLKSKLEHRNGWQFRQRMGFPYKLGPKNPAISEVKAPGKVIYFRP